MKETQEFSNGVGPDSGQSSVAVGVFVLRILRELNSNGAKYEGHSKAQKSFKKKKKKKRDNDLAIYTRRVSGGTNYKYTIGGVTQSSASSGHPSVPIVAPSTTMTVLGTSSLRK